MNINEIIKKELDTSKYELKPIKKTFKVNYPRKESEEITLIELTTENVQKVEAMLKYNSFYNQFNDLEKINKEEVINKLNNIKNESKEEYSYSSITYIKLFKYAMDNNLLNNNLYQIFIYIILKKINQENSTRVHGKTITKLKDKLVERFSNSKSLIKGLKEPIKNDYEIIRILTQKIGNRHNFSLATKFCHYMCFNIFDDTKEQDLYSIYDSVVKNNLEFYYEYYVNDKCETLNNDLDRIRKYKYNSDELKKEKNNSVNFLIERYKVFQELIDEILASKKVNNKISRNGFDHIVWYTRK